MPGGAYGDSLGGMTIAGGIAAALYGRKVSGEPSALEISLLALGAWANQFTVNLALFNGGPLPKVERRSEGRNPLTLTYRTADDRWIQLSMLQPGRYWPEFCRHVGREDLITDERFATVDALLANSLEAIGIVTEVIGSRTLAEWFDAFTGMQGQWAAVQNSWELGNDEALLANGRIVEVVDADGVTRKLVANPVKFDDVPLALTRAPQFAEHTDEILSELGYSEEQALDFKIAGAVT
jgi:crotonobetainyl-CoA:carnitine CoA-transferase CaiB-like acyl-CoA transferase